MNEVRVIQPLVGEIVVMVLPNGKHRPLLVCHVFGDLQRGIGGTCFAYPPEDGSAIIGINRVDYSDLNETGTWHYRSSKATLTLVQ